MNKKFDFDHIGKREPYEVPDNFFQHLEERIMNEATPKRTRYRFSWHNIATVAASVAAIVAFAFYIAAPSSHNAYTMDNVEQAFSKLSDTDQDYIIEIYQEDIFINY